MNAYQINYYGEFKLPTWKYLIYEATNEYGIPTQARKLLGTQQGTSMHTDSWKWEGESQIALPSRCVMNTDIVDDFEIKISIEI